MKFQVLDASPVHAKALYRRGMAYMEAGDFEEARNDFNKVMFPLVLACRLYVMGNE